MRSTGHWMVAVVSLGALLAAADPATASHPSFELVSVATDGTQSDGWSGHLGAPAISDDGSVVAFTSAATNLVPGDTNDALDVFVRDRATRTTSRVSVASDGAQADGASTFTRGPSLSGDGRYVLFSALASNLVPGDTNGAYDVFLHDRLSATTSLVSATPAGAPGNGSSGSSGVALSGDGRYAAFTSTADDLVTGDTPAQDLFVRDLRKGSTVKATVALDGAQADAPSFGPQFSHDGRRLVFSSAATNLVQGDTNGQFDVFLWDRRGGLTGGARRSGAAGTLQRVSVSADGLEADGVNVTASISADGQVVAYSSTATNLHPDDPAPDRDILVRDLASGRIELVTGGEDGTSQFPSLSADGRFVAFASDAKRLVPCGQPAGRSTDAFVTDRATGSTALISRAPSGVASGSSSEPLLTPDARHTVFASWAGNLVDGDANTTKDVFVHELPASLPVTIYCPTPAATRANEVVVAGAATPGATVEVFDGEARLGAAVAGGYGAWELPAVLAEGRHELRSVASTGESPGSLLVIVDQTPPTTGITTPDGDEQQSIPGIAEVHITGTADDGAQGSGVSRVALRFTPVRTVGGGNGFVTTATGTEQWEWRGHLATGVWRVTAQAVDVVRLFDQEPATITLYVVP